jgi:rare lipoprotein A
MILALSGCFRRAPPPPAPRLVAAPHYFLGAPYQADGHWYYPEEDYGFDHTGIAALQGAHPGLTADGEIYDPAIATGAMQTIQLPAIAQVTNLENGRQILVRVNDRGPQTPARLIALSPRAALLLAMTGPARVRVKVDVRMSHDLVDQLGGPALAIATAPSAKVSAQTLPPPGSNAAAGPVRSLATAASRPTGPRVPDRLPEIIHQVGADPGPIFIDAASFGRFDYANVLASSLSGLGAVVLQSREGRQTVFSVRAGPFGSIAQADKALAQALRAGALDAHLTVDP